MERYNMGLCVTCQKLLELKSVIVKDDMTWYIFSCSGKKCKQIHKIWEGHLDEI